MSRYMQTLSWLNMWACLKILVYMSHYVEDRLPLHDSVDVRRCGRKSRIAWNAIQYMIYQLVDGDLLVTPLFNARDFLVNKLLREWCSRLKFFGKELLVRLLELLDVSVEVVKLFIRSLDVIVMEAERGDDL